MVSLHVLALTVLAASVATAAGARGGQQTGAGPIRVVLDGQPQPLMPIMVRGRVMVPVRGTLEAAGARVEWNRSTRTVTATKRYRHVALVVGTRMARVNQRSIPLDVPPVIHEGRVYVPLRFVSESLGAKVTWDQARRQVSITTRGTAAAQLRNEPQGTGAARRGQ